MKLFIVVNHDWFFLSHRKEIGVAAKNAGWDVTIVACDTGCFDEIHSLGLKTINLPINATGMNPKEEWKTFYFLMDLYKKEKPDVYAAFTKTSKKSAYIKITVKEGDK